MPRPSGRRGRPIGSRNGVEMDPFRMREFDLLCREIGAPNRRTLPMGAERAFRDNVLPRWAYDEIDKMADYFTCSTLLIVRCAVLALTRKVAERIPALADFGYLPAPRVGVYPVDSPVWRRFAALCEEFDTAWDEFETHNTGRTFAMFTDDEMGEIKRAAAAYGVSRGRFAPVGVIHMIRRWRGGGHAGDEVER